MRISMDKKDTHFNDALGRYVRVFVNGFEQKYAITVDEERGYVVRARQPFSVNHKGEIRRERVYGRVRIEFKPGTPKWLLEQYA